MYIMKSFKALSKMSTVELVLIGAAVLALGYVLYNYTSLKSMKTDDFQTKEESTPTLSSVPDLNTHVGTGGDAEPASAVSAVSMPAAVSGMSTNTHNVNMTEVNTVNPSDLLPVDENSEWGSLHNNKPETVNMLEAGIHNGINTVSSSLRNANLQLRSEPPNPVGNAGPWNQSTIVHDNNKRQFEIGSGVASM